jgi:hypothetical protein
VRRGAGGFRWRSTKRWRNPERAGATRKFKDANDRLEEVGVLINSGKRREIFEYMDTLARQSASASGRLSEEAHRGSWMNPDRRTAAALRLLKLSGPECGEARRGAGGTRTDGSDGARDAGARTRPGEAEIKGLRPILASRDHKNETRLLVEACDKRRRTPRAGAS